MSAIPIPTYIYQKGKIFLLSFIHLLDIIEYFLPKDIVYEVLSEYLNDMCGEYVYVDYNNLYDNECDYVNLCDYNYFINRLKN